MRKIKVNVDIPYGYYYCGKVIRSIVLSVNNRVAAQLERLLAEGSPVYKEEVMTRRMLAPLNARILRICYEILIESCLDPDYDCADESIEPCMLRDIRSGAFKPDLEAIDYDVDYVYCGICCRDEDEDEGVCDVSAEELVEKYYQKLKDQYVEWVDGHTQEFRAEVYGLFIDCCLEDEIEYDIESLLPADSDAEVYAVRYRHEWKIEDVLKV